MVLKTLFSKRLQPCCGMYKAGSALTLPAFFMGIICLVFYFHIGVCFLQFGLILITAFGVYNNIAIIYFVSGINGLTNNIKLIIE